MDELKKLMGRFNGLIIKTRPRDFLRLGYNELHEYWYIYHSNDINQTREDIYKEAIQPIEELLGIEITYDLNNFSDTRIQIDDTWIKAVKKANKKLRKEFKEKYGAYN